MEITKQDQCAGDGSINLQAHGNITIGVTYSEARQIAEDVFQKNFPFLVAEAKKIVEERANELIIELLIKLQNSGIPIDIASDPDMQYSIFTAQRDYARSGKIDLKNLLVDVLVERAKIGNSELKKIVLNEAIEIAPKLTTKQLNAISLRFLISYSKSNEINSMQTFYNYLYSKILPFCNGLTLENYDYQHIEYAGCGGTEPMFRNNVYDCFKRNYPGVLSVGFDVDEKNKLGLTNEQINKMIVPCLRNNSKFQVNAMSDDAIFSESKLCGLDANKIQDLQNLQNSNLISKESFELELVKINGNFSNLFSAWGSSGLGGLKLTTVGIALAHANIRRVTGTELELDIWIKD